MIINKKNATKFIKASRLILLCLIITGNSVIADNIKPKNKEDDLLKKSESKKLIPALYESEIAYDEDNSYLNNLNNPYDFDDNLDDDMDSLWKIEQKKWIITSALNNAPDLLKGILVYLENNGGDDRTIPSFHRFILVGPPGSGKTTLAHAIAHMLDSPIMFVPATSLLGQYRNETSVNITRFLEQYTTKGNEVVIIFDELHKLFEHHTNDRTDDSQSAAAFWLMLDKIEKCNPHAIIIGTANNVETLPAEIKSRFSGKIITLPLPNKKQKVQAFKNSITYDPDVKLHKSIDDAFIMQIIEEINNCSLRDVKLIIDTAKMFYYANYYVDVEEIHDCELPIILKKHHFQRALNQLRAESKVLEKSFIEKHLKQLEPWGAFFSMAANITSLMRFPLDISYFLHSNKNHT